MKRTCMIFRQRKQVPWLFLSPLLAGVLLFFIWPFALTAEEVFSSGAEIFHDLFSSSSFWLAVKNTIRFLFTAVPLNIFLGLVLALALQKQFCGVLFFRSALLFPLVVPAACIVMTVRVFLAERGIVNALLFSMGLPVAGWTGGPAAFLILVLLYLWKNCGYTMVLFLAGLNLIPREQYQCAMLDGAGAWQRLLFVTLPQLRQTGFFVLIVSVIGAFKSFREAFLLFGRHPHESIYMLQHFISNNFDNLNYRRLSAASLLLLAGFLAVMGIVFFAYRKIRRG